MMGRGVSFVTSLVGTMGAIYMAQMAIYFQMSVVVQAGYMGSMDNSYPYLQAVAMHDVNGEPFLYYLSEALKAGGPVGDGVNVVEELGSFGETFALVNATGSTVASTGGMLASLGEGTYGELNIKKSYLAVPPGGYLVMTYAWQ